MPVDFHFPAKPFYNKSYRPRWKTPNVAKDSDIKVENDEDNAEVYSDTEIPHDEIKYVEPLLTPRKRKGI